MFTFSIKKVLCFTFVVSLISLFAVTPIADFEVDFTRDTAIEINGKEYRIAGDGFETLADGQKVMLFGRRNALHVPVRDKIGTIGTLVWQFALKPFQPFQGTPRRPMVTLNTNSRLKAGFSTGANVVPPFVQYSFGDGNLSLHHVQNNLEFNKLYTAAMSFDGSRVCCYLDGVLIHEGKQPIPLEANPWRDLFIGPVKDGWIDTGTWNEDTMGKRIQLFNRVLTAPEIAELSGLQVVDISARYPNILSVPGMRNPKADVQLDGNLQEPIWNQAASLFGMINLSNPEKSWRIPANHVRFFCDAQNLYIGFTSLLPAGTNIKIGPAPSDGEKEVWGSESFELYFVNQKDHYRFAGSFAGGSTESKNKDVNYNPVWTYRTSNKMQVDDSVYWQGEIRIPWQSIGFAAPPKDGVKFNFCRTWHLNDELIISALSRPGYGYDDYEAYTLLFPVEEAPGLQVTAKNDPTYGNLEQKITAYSRSPFNARFQITLENSQGMITPEIAFRKDLQLAPGANVAFSLNIPLTASNLDSLVFTLSDSEGKNIYQQQVLPVRISSDYLSVLPLFGQEKVLVQYRKNQAEAKFGKGLQAKLVLVSPDNADLYSLAANLESTEIPFAKDNPAGMYRVELRSADDSKILSASSFPFTGFGEWSRLQFDNRIIPPFTPLEISGDASRKTVAMWGRNYVLAEDSLFPVQMMSREQQLLTCPVALRINGKAIPATAKTSWGTSEKHRFEYTSNATSQEWKIKNRAWIEYDGVSFYQVEVEALQNLGTIELAFTLPRTIAKYLHAAAGPWGNKITDTVKNGKRSLRYYPVLFLGDEEKGFCFFTESRHSWPEKGTHVMAVQANNSAAELTVSLAPSLETGETFTFEFGLLGTPIKKLPENYPLNIMGGYSELNRPGKTPTSYTSFTKWMDGQTHGDCLANLPPENNPLLNLYQKEITRLKQYGTKPFPYAMKMSIPDEYPEVAAFLQEWKVVPLQPYPYTKNGQRYGVHTLCPTTAACEFYVWNTQQLLKQAKFGGLYFDYGTTTECNNNLHGCYGRTAILATREHLRRIALALFDSGANDYVIVMHNTDHIQVPALTFVTHLFNGEHIRQASSSLLHDGKDILDTYPLAMFACELNSLPFGITNSGYMPADVLSPKYGGGKEKPELYVLRMTRAMLAGMLVHNSMPAMNRCHHGIFDKVVRIYDAFGVPKAKFFGYYNPENPAVVIEGDEVYASTYRHANGKEMLAVVAHLGNTRIDQTVKIRFRPEKLGMSPFVKATEQIDADDPEYQDLYTLRKQNGVPNYRAPLDYQPGGAKIIDFKDGILTLELKAHTFALIKLE